jgi:hypothetical protein
MCGHDARRASSTLTRWSVGAGTRPTSLRPFKARQRRTSSPLRFERIYHSPRGRNAGCGRTDSRLRGGKRGDRHDSESRSSVSRMTTTYARRASVHTQRPLAPPILPRLPRLPWRFWPERRGLDSVVTSHRGWVFATRPARNASLTSRQISFARGELGLAGQDEDAHRPGDSTDDTAGQCCSWTARSWAPPTPQSSQKRSRSSMR